MKAYTDTLGNLLTKDDVRLAVQVVSGMKNVTPYRLHRPTRWGIGKASNVLNMLGDAGVLGDKQNGGQRSIILKGEPAVNAGLRLLKKSRK